MLMQHRFYLADIEVCRAEIGEEKDHLAADERR
jgi:hypothetical protein